MYRLVLILAVLGWLTPVASRAATLTGDFADFAGSATRGNLALYRPGEAVNITFTATGVSVGQTLTVNIKDSHDTQLATQTSTVSTSPNWSTTVTGYNAKLGFYRVYASLNGTPVQAKVLSLSGTCPPGYITYCIVPDPRQRPSYVPELQALFGMQGGYVCGTDLAASLGWRWNNDPAWSWGPLSPSYTNKYVGGNSLTPGVRASFATNGSGVPWTVYGLPNLTGGGGLPYGGNPYVYQSGTLVTWVGALLPAYYGDWSDFCAQVAWAWPAVNTNCVQPMYELTWEPIVPWGYLGSSADLVAFYQQAYTAIKSHDPQAWVIGPAMDVNPPDFDAGLGNYLDAFSAHPYMYSDTGIWLGCLQDPELIGQPDGLRTQKRRLRKYIGHDIPMMGHEQGYPAFVCKDVGTTGNPQMQFSSNPQGAELDMARRLIRSNLLVLGEGWLHNVTFYPADGPENAGTLGRYWQYGYFYNLDVAGYGGYGPSKVMPKPVVAAYAAMTFLMERRSSVCDINWLSATTRGYAFQSCTDPNDVVLALWDFSGTPQSTTISVGSTVSSVDVYDWMGNKTAVSTPGGIFSYSLTNEPIYVKGVAASTWGAARPNRVISTGKPVVASTTADSTNYPASYAVDGDSVSDLSRWLSASDAAKPAAWIYVDLGATYPVNEVRFWTGQYYQAINTSAYNTPPSSYRIQTSLDASVWTTIVNRSGNSKAVVDETFTSTSARYVRLYVPSGITTQVMLYELQVLTSDAPPTVTMAAPSANQVITAGNNIQFQASAADSDGTVSSVKFHQGSTLLGQATSSPYTYTWNNVAAGIYCVTAVATDNTGVSTTSSPVNITVIQTGGAITVTAPIALTNAIGGGAGTVTWTSTGTVGNVNVDFSDDGGTSWTRLGRNLPNSGSRSVQWPYAASSNCRVRVQDVAGGTKPLGMSAAFTLQGVTAQGIQVNDGSAQRSMVTGLTVTFNHVVTCDSGAFTLVPRGGSAVTVSASNPSKDGKTYLLSFSGTGILASSLADGIYDLTVSAAKVHNAIGLSPASDTTLTFHRLFGDINDDKAVNTFDYAKFKLAFNNPAGYNAAFDYNGDGVVNTFDYAQFKLRFNLISFSY